MRTIEKTAQDRDSAGRILLADGVHLRELVNSGCGAGGVSTGIVTFAKRASLGYHKHSASEAIIVLQGAARVSVEGRRYHPNTVYCGSANAT
jgi:quercetin dioxygenase-like cupin family protein